LDESKGGGPAQRLSPPAKAKQARTVPRYRPTPRSVDADHESPVPRVLLRVDVRRAPKAKLVRRAPQAKLVRRAHRGARADAHHAPRGQREPRLAPGLMARRQVGDARGVVAAVVVKGVVVKGVVVQRPAAARANTQLGREGGR